MVSGKKRGVLGAGLTGEAVAGGSFLSGGEWNFTKASP